MSSKLSEKITLAMNCMMDIDSAQIDSKRDSSDDDTRRDHSLLQMNIVPVEPGTSMEIKVSPTIPGTALFLRTFETSHGGHPSQGYVLVSKKSIKTIKRDLKHLDTSSIRKMVQQGISIHDIDDIENVEFCYTGDTSIDGLLGSHRSSTDASNLIQAFDASLFLCEVTYVDDGYEVKARQRGHMHVSDLKTIFNEQWNTSKKDKVLILCHLSSRGGTIDRMLPRIFHSLPMEVAKNTFVSVASFNHEHKSDGVWSLMCANGLMSLKSYMDYKETR